MILNYFIFFILTVTASLSNAALESVPGGAASLSEYFKDGSGCSCDLGTCAIALDRITLRRATELDRPAIKDILRGSDVIKNYLLLKERSNEVEQSQVAQLLVGLRLTHSESWGPSRKYNFVIEFEGAVVGIGNFERFLALEEWEIGYALAEGQRGNGFAIEAIEGMIQFIRATVPHGMVTATPLESNHRSHELLRRAGFKRNDGAVRFDPNPTGETQANFELSF